MSVIDVQCESGVEKRNSNLELRDIKQFRFKV